MYTNLHAHMAENPPRRSSDPARSTRSARHASNPAPKEDVITSTINIKLKLVGLFTTIALFALPIADALACRAWN
jgi:hypothetical protein